MTDPHRARAERLSRHLYAIARDRNTQLADRVLTDQVDAITTALREVTAISEARVARAMAEQIRIHDIGVQREEGHGEPRAVGFADNLARAYEQRRARASNIGSPR